MHMLVYTQTLRYQIADGCDCLLVVSNKFLIGLLKLRVENIACLYLNTRLFISIL